MKKLEFTAETMLALADLGANIPDGTESHRSGVERLVAMARTAIGTGDEPRVRIAVPASLASVVEDANRVLRERGWEIAITPDVAEAWVEARA